MFQYSNIDIFVIWRTSPNNPKVCILQRHTTQDRDDYYEYCHCVVAYRLDKGSVPLLACTDVKLLSILKIFSQTRFLIQIMISVRKLRRQTAMAVFTIHRFRNQGTAISFRFVNTHLERSCSELRVNIALRRFASRFRRRAARSRTPL